MLPTLAGIVIEVKLVARENTDFSMLVNWDPGSNVTELKLVSENVDCPMLATFAGIVIEVKAELKNAPDPMLATPAGILMEVIAVPRNAPDPMLVN